MSIFCVARLALPFFQYSTLHCPEFNFKHLCLPLCFGLIGQYRQDTTVICSPSEEYWQDLGLNLRVLAQCALI